MLICSLFSAIPSTKEQALIIFKPPNVLCHVLKETLLMASKITKNKVTLISGFLLLAVLACFSMSSRAWGTAYYVDAINGDDLNPGTSAAFPWGTIQHAADVAQPGDTVYVEEGTYNERIYFTNSGTSENNITFRSSPRRVATVNGGFDINQDYICVEGFRITSDVNGMSAIEISGEFVDVVDNYFFNVRGRAICGDVNKKPRGAYIANNHIYHSQMGFCVYGTNWLVKNNEVERLYNYYSSDCDYARFFGDRYIENCPFFVTGFGPHPSLMLFCDFMGNG